MRSHLILAILLLLVGGCCPSDQDKAYTKVSDESLPVPAIDCAPRNYVCYRTTVSPVIDGKLDESDWQRAPWTELFVDIEGDAKPSPRFATRAKMLWDDTYFYVAGDMEEPDVWAKLTDRDAVIYYDNDFEVFIDPDGDTHEYYELEVNAFGTEWDLFLGKPYRDGGPAIHAWDIRGLKSAVHIDGTLNRPGDTDRGWSIEIAIPWVVLKECAHRDTPPNDGDQWRVNFSRVEWQTRVVDGRYEKVVDSADGKPLPENNWVWSPQGLIAMHYPEMWGLVQFSTLKAAEKTVDFVPSANEEVKWALRRYYYAQRTHRMQYGVYADDVERLKLDVAPPEGWTWPPVVHVTPNWFEASAVNTVEGKRWIICADGDIREEAVPLR